MAQRFDFTGSEMTFGAAIAANPNIDHFHIVEIDNGDEWVFHANVIDGRVFEGEKDITDTPMIESGDKVVADEWHERS